MSIVDCVYYDSESNVIPGTSKRYKITQHAVKEISERLTLMEIIRDAITFKYNRILILSNGVQNYINNNDYANVLDKCYNDIIKANIKSFEVVEAKADAKPVSVIFQGGLGNRLFQLFTVLAFSKKYNRPFVVDQRFSQPNKHSQNDYVRFYEQYIGNVGNEIGVFEEHYEDCCNFIDIAPLAEKQIPVIFKGFYQSHLYFNDIKPLIRDILKPTKTEQKYINERYGDLSNAVFIHYRLTDNVPENTKHYIDLKQYYPKAIKRMIDKYGNGNNIHFMIVCDEFAKLEEKYSESLALIDAKNKTYVKEDEVMTLFIMHQCRLGGIGATSTYSWWGGYLNPGLIITPSRYMTQSEVQPKNPATFFYPGMEIIAV